MGEPPLQKHPEPLLKHRFIFKPFFQNGALKGTLDFQLIISLVDCRAFSAQIFPRFFTLGFMDFARVLHLLFKEENRRFPYVLPED
ncbi:hypothetical protein EFB08_22925 [Rufibacter latericius]|uniref:Uncharacterized protein n=1 Tax=Rufibacter latericius TaxID=2487040 RepID=A0A3M9M8S6_9BACT|nr:hypothetical protein EFB08_22925 [Rufibacter latericius]